MKTKTITKKKKDNDSVIISVNTLQGAKEKIYSDIQNGINYRDIVKTKFDINGTIKSFNISQVNQIKAEFEPKNRMNSQDSDRALVFKLFKKGFSPAEVLIKTRFSFEFIKQAREEYNEFTNRIDVPQSFIRNLKQDLFKITNCKYLGDIETAVYEAVEGYLENKKFVYSCCRCGKEMPISDKTLKDARNYLSKKWGHSECVN